MVGWAIGIYRLGVVVAGMCWHVYVPHRSRPHRDA